MSFREFKFPDVLGQLGLTIRNEDFTSSAGLATLRSEFLKDLQDGAELALALRTEKAKSEFIIAPVLLEARRQTAGTFGLFSGEEFNVDPAKGLNGVCDFLITRQPMQYLITTPIVVVAEAKNDDLHTGYGQCIAGMGAAQIFNQRHGQEWPVYGIVSIGSDWKFLRLDGIVLTMDRPTYYLTEVGKIIGIIKNLVESVALAPVAA